MRRRAAGLALTVSVAAAAGCGAPGGTPAATPFEATGEGPGGSAAIDLTAGAYVLIWSASPVGAAASCQHRAALETTDEMLIHPLMNQTVNVALLDQIIPLPTTAAGHYYIDVNSDCRWSFQLRPVE